MATAGEVTYGAVGGTKRTICLAAGITAASGAPSAATDGHPAYEDTPQLWSKEPAAAFYLMEAPEKGLVTVTSTAGSGTMTATVSIYGYLADTGEWYLIADLNAGNAIEETGADAIAYAEEVEGIGYYDRLYAEVTPAGTGTALDVHLTVLSKAGR